MALKDLAVLDADTLLLASFNRSLLPYNRSLLPYMYVYIYVYMYICICIGMCGAQGSGRAGC